MAQKHSAAYYFKTRLTATLSSKDDHRSANAKNFSNASQENKKDEPTVTKQVLIAATRSKCFFCGRAYHEQKYCPAINSTCFSCKKIGCFSRGVGQITALEKVTIYKSKCNLVLLLLTSMACPGNLLRSAILVNLNGKNLTVLIYSGSSESNINSKVCKDLEFKVYTSKSEIQMASSAMKRNQMDCVLLT